MMEKTASQEDARPATKKDQEDGTSPPTIASIGMIEEPDKHP